MNHDEDDDARELFARLEAELNADRDDNVVDIDQARAQRAQQKASSGADGHRGNPDEASVYEPAPAALVDKPAPTGLGWLQRLQTEKRRPVIPAWLRSKAELQEAARWMVGHYAHTTAFHAVRLPAYAGKLLARSPLVRRASCGSSAAGRATSKGSRSARTPLPRKTPSST